jgi:hypothetical protein|tara:strand:+ start:353 stop:661 length:309 start_codon:yes stop_codon:yes gene_type:complete
MPSKEPNETSSIQIANQIINIANTRMKDGMLPDEVAQGLRHAAANFSAFVEFRKGGGDPESIYGEFAQLLEYYLERHGTSEEKNDLPAVGLNNLIKQVKEEF